MKIRIFRFSFNHLESQAIMQPILFEKRIFNFRLMGNLIWVTWDIFCACSQQRTVHKKCSCWCINIRPQINGDCVVSATGAQQGGGTTYRCLDRHPAPQEKIILYPQYKRFSSSDIVLDREKSLGGYFNTRLTLAQLIFGKSQVTPMFR